MVTSEIGVQREALADWADDLLRRIDEIGRGPGTIGVVDTNVLMHHAPPANVDWAAVLDVSAPIRVLTPLRVVEELDEHKWSPKTELRKRARAVLAAIETTVGKGTHGELRPGVTFQIAGGLASTTRRADADADVLDSCHEIQQFTASSVTLISGDKAMRVRAAAEGLRAREMPAKYRNRPDA